MSVMKIRRKTKTVWRVHWREAEHHRTRHFNRKQDAVLYDAEVKRRKQLGDLHTLNRQPANPRRVRPGMVPALRHPQPRTSNPTLLRLPLGRTRPQPPRRLPTPRTHSRNDHALPPTTRACLRRPLLDPTHPRTAARHARTRRRMATPHHQPGQGRAQASATSQEGDPGTRTPIGRGHALVPTRKATTARRHPDQRPRLRRTSPRRSPRPHLERRPRNHPADRASRRIRPDQEHQDRSTPRRPTPRPTRPRSQPMATRVRQAQSRHACLPRTRWRAMDRRRLASLAT